MDKYIAGAKALYEHENSKRPGWNKSPSWNDATQKIKDRYRDRAKAVIDACEADAAR